MLWMFIAENLIKTVCSVRVCVCVYMEHSLQTIEHFEKLVWILHDICLNIALISLQTSRN